MKHSGTVRRLIQRSCDAYREGGWRLFCARLSRWLEHQWSRQFPNRSYQEWIYENTPTAVELELQRKRAQAMPPDPMISLLCPIHHPSLPILRETINSVLSQTYPHWELCLAVSGKDSPSVISYLQELAESESRIQLVPMERNLGISKSTNAALEAANGEWVAFLDHDDLLAPQALYSVAMHILAHPDCQVLYTDEDLLSSDGKFRKQPTLKPDWSPEMLLHFNYICHFLVMKKYLIERCGGLQADYDGAQDWDLLLRVSEFTDAIHHIPEILYHWRESKQSTAGDVSAKPYAADAQYRAVKACYQRRGIACEAQRTRLGHYRPIWDRGNEPLVSVIIPNRNQCRLIRKVVDGLLRSTGYRNIEIIIVDNNSTDLDVIAFYQEYQFHHRLQVVEFDEAFNYSRACNTGANAAKGELLLFLNNDIEVIDENWLNELVGWGIQPGVGVVGGHLIYPNGRTQHAGVALGLFDLVGHLFHDCPPETISQFGRAEWSRNLLAVTGACQLIRRELFHKLQGYDEGYRIVYSDIDLCLRAIERGQRVVYNPHCRLIHHESSTREPGNNHEDTKRFAERLADLGIVYDPYFHPALSPASACPQLKTLATLSASDNFMQQLEKFLEFETSGIHFPVITNQEFSSSSLDPS